MLYQFMLTLPITVSSSERSFSKLKLIKNYLRSTMSNDRLFYLIISSIESDLLDEIDIKKLVNDWAKMKDTFMCKKLKFKFILTKIVLFMQFVLSLFLYFLNVNISVRRE